MNPARLLAFYLPQFHPIPENDGAWGPGFTEWHNVVRARPRFHGHQQPRLPADLGFYDLRLPEAREAQAELAAAHGVTGFVYYHYWFGGRRLLSAPLDEVRRLGRPSFPFALCWANENWTRRWDGAEHEVIARQSHSAEDDEQHGRWLAEAAADERYITVDGKPLLLIYKISLLPDPARTQEVFRAAFARAGREVYLVAVEAGPPERAMDARALGYDATVDFFPDWADLPAPRNSLVQRVSAATGRAPRDQRVIDYATAVRRRMAKPPRLDPPAFPTVCPGWDNSPRRRDGAVILHGHDPGVYAEWLRASVEQVQALPSEQRLVFVNAWNEWAEGAVLEPSDVDGRAFLEATASVMRGS